MNGCRLNPAAYDLVFDLADADLLNAERVGLAELSLWYTADSDAGRHFVILLCDERVLAVFADDDHGAAAGRYFADVLAGLRYAQAEA